jgi:hypothetical protein
MTNQDVDPFADESAPSVSFKNAPVGTTKTLEVLEPAVLLQTRDYKTGEPANWPDGNPKMAAVVKVKEDDEVKSVWASKPSSLYRAISEAQKTAGRLEPGDELIIRFDDTKEQDDPKKEAQKLYRAKINKGVYKTKAAPKDDPFAEPDKGAAGLNDEPPF